MRKKGFFIILLFYLILDLKGQDPQFSQFYAIPLYLAPSYAGSTKGTRINVNYRNQWPGVGNVYETYAFSIDHYFNKFHSGIGLFLLRDRSGKGNLGITAINLQYAYNIKLSKTWRLRPGISFIYVQRGVDFDALKFPDQITTGSGTTVIFDRENNKRSAFDFSTSILAHNEIQWIGISVDHLMRPNLTYFTGYEDYKVPIKYSVFGGTRITRKGRLLRTMSESFSTSFLFKKQGDQYQLDFGGYWYKNPVMIGAWFRGFPLYKGKFFSRDAVIFMVGYKDEKYSVAYSFDFTISNLLIRTFGSHELSFTYKFNQEWERKKRPKLRPIPCPTF